MTTLAEVIKDAIYGWLEERSHGGKSGLLSDHIAAAVLAHLAAPETVQRMALAMTAWQYADTQGRREAIEGDMRAAVAALAEDGR